VKVYCITNQGYEKGSGKRNIFRSFSTNRIELKLNFHGGISIVEKSDDPVYNYQLRLLRKREKRKKLTLTQRSHLKDRLKRETGLLSSHFWEQNRTKH